MTTRIQRKRARGYRLPPDAVCVTRPGKWGNPFKGPKAVEYFRAMMTGFWAHAMSGIEGLTIHNASFRLTELERRASWMHSHLHELRGKRLACYCAPDKPCHADVLIELLSRTEAENRPRRG